MSLNRVFVALALASVAFTSPLDQGLAIAQRTRQIDSQMIKAFNCHGAQSSNCTMADLAGSTGDMGIIETRIRAALECRGQSCLVADTSGSTGRLPNMKAEGASAADLACIVAHNPPLAELLRKYSDAPPDVPKQDTGASSTLMIGLNSAARPLTALTGSTEKGTFSGSCSTNILIFAKGTFEPGTYGTFVGNALTSGLPWGWTAHGVSYDADVPGDFCLGLPGGMVATDVINQAAAKCPSSNLFVGGYSQGAMVIRNGLARANPSARARVKGVVTFGDPFNGAPIKGYNGPIAIFCNSGDGVCTGNFELAGSHLSYGVDGSAGQAQKKLLEMARGGGDNSCCRPRPEIPLPSPEQWARTIKANGGKPPKAQKGTSIDAWAQAILDSNGGIPRYSQSTSSWF